MGRNKFKTEPDTTITVPISIRKRLKKLGTMEDTMATLLDRMITKEELAQRQRSRVVA